MHAIADELGKFFYKGNAMRTILLTAALASCTSDDPDPFDIVECDDWAHEGIGLCEYACSVAPEPDPTPTQCTIGPVGKKCDLGHLVEEGCCFRDPTRDPPVMRVMRCQP